MADVGSLCVALVELLFLVFVFFLSFFLSFCLFVLFVLFAFGLPLSLLFSSCPAVLATRNAIDALGGMATIESASKNMKETVHLQLRSQDPTSHAIIGKRQDEKAVLLKVLLFALREKTHFCGLLHRPPKPPGGAFWRQSLLVHAGSPLFFFLCILPTTRSADARRQQETLNRTSKSSLLVTSNTFTDSQVPPALCSWCF